MIIKRRKRGRQHVRTHILSLGLSLSCFTPAVWATDIPSALQYTTVGIWADAPLGPAARVGLALPLRNNTAMVAGREMGLRGDKTFIGWRENITPHGYGWGSFELARWSTHDNALLAKDQQIYYGASVQLAFFRGGVMLPTGGMGHPRFSLGLGLSY